jgi:hypothetical protein
MESWMDRGETMEACCQQLQPGQPVGQRVCRIGGTARCRSVMPPVDRVSAAGLIAAAVGAIGARKPV